MPPSISSADVRVTDAIGQVEVLFASPLKFRLLPNTTTANAPAAVYHLMTDVHRRGLPGNNIYVLRAKLSSGNNGTATGGVDVVVKVALTRKSFGHLIREDQFYHDHLEAFAGVRVPTSYGVHEVTNINEFEEAEYAYDCLILKDCGETIGSLRCHLGLSIGARERSPRLTQSAHPAWPDQCPPHSPFLVDFSLAKSDQTCPRAPIGERVPLGANPEPSLEEFKCEELYKLLEDARGWRPTIFRFCGYEYGLDFLDDPIALANMAEGITPAEAFQLAHEAILKYCEE